MKKTIISIGITIMFFLTIFSALTVTASVERKEILEKTVEDDTPPNAPIQPTGGPMEPIVGIEYVYYTGVPIYNETGDFDGFNISSSLWLCWDFDGDEEFDYFSQPGMCCGGMSKAYWTWEKCDDYEIKVKTRKTLDNGKYVYSDWSKPLSVTAPKPNSRQTYPVLMKLLDLFSSRYPVFIKLLNL